MSTEMIVMSGIFLAAAMSAALVYFNHCLKVQRMKKLEKSILKKGLPVFFEQAEIWTDKVCTEMIEKSMEMAKETIGY